MIANITELLNNFTFGFTSCVIKFPSSNSTIPLFAPIIDIVDLSTLDEEIEDEDGNTYSVHLIMIDYSNDNFIRIKAYWTSDVSYDDDIGKWKQQTLA